MAYFSSGQSAGLVLQSLYLDFCVTQTPANHDTLRPHFKLSQVYTEETDNKVYTIQTVTVKILAMIMPDTSENNDAGNGGVEVGVTGRDFKWEGIFYWWIWAVEFNKG